MARPLPNPSKALFTFLSFDDEAGAVSKGSCDVVVDPALTTRYAQEEMIEGRRLGYDVGRLLILWTSSKNETSNDDPQVEEIDCEHYKQ